MIKEIKIKIGQYRYKIQLEEKKNRLYLHFPYNVELLKEIKAMEGAKYHGYDEENPRKIWSIANSPRNQFQLEYLQGGNPYAHYDKELEAYEPRRKLYQHQTEGTRFILTRRQCIVADEMGLGKTLETIEALEEFNRRGELDKDDIYWVGPRSGLIAVQYEFYKWKSELKPKFYTYDALKRIDINAHIPKAIIFDECQKLKTPMSQRSQAARQIADKVREKNGFIIELSGTPAPKSPLDWWNISDIACPGYLREGSLKAFQSRLALVQQKETLQGGMYPKLETWWDNPNKCKICGKLKDSFEHESNMIMMESNSSSFHEFVPSKDEVSFLYERLKGLVIRRTKKDCLDIPDKIFRIIECQPSESTQRAVKLIIKKSKNAITALTLLRELSDGFQYQEEELDNLVTCPPCFGNGFVNIPVDNTICPKCKGFGNVNQIARKTVEVPCPKDAALADLLEEYEDIGRVVIGGGFTGTVDRIAKLVKKEGWNYVRVDGRGWHSDLPVKTPQEMLTAFQDAQDMFPKVAFVAQPESGGIGLTLTASPVCICFSNTFNGDGYQQFIDRIHRIGMDSQRGAMIINLIHLDTDRKVLENLEKKKDLQSMTLGELEQA